MSANISDLVKVPFRLSYASDSDVILRPHRLIGVEVEVEGIKSVPSSSKINGWHLVDEYSLRNHGREFVSEPMMGDDIPDMMMRLFDSLTKSMNNKPVFSKRCSIHVHVDCRRKTLKELIACTRNYMFLEPLLFKYIGQGRSKNIYCVPLSKSDALTLNAARILSDEKFFDAKLGTSGSKYSAYNLIPLGKYGTIEWRHHPGSLHVDEVIDWINIVLCVMESGKIDIAKEVLNGDVMNILNDVFGPVLSVLTPHITDAIIEEGLGAARNFDLLYKLDKGSKGVLKCRYKRSALYKLSNGEL